MLRQTMLGSIAAVLLAPAALVAGATPASATADHHEWGRLGAADRVLRSGCRVYRYRYRIQPPAGDWGLETFLIGPGGKKLGSGAHLSGYNPTVGTGTFTICKNTTRPGRFVIRGKLSVQNGPDDYVEGWIKPVAFKLRRR
ncbi:MULTISPECIES: hypothetical protein [Nocardioides]|uniref:Uncharacterized protein n=1 Tax=Nocardioides lianchengensis TaxID=1045774 RepID=A0A1G7BZG4_9ACTN|nr:hypothetical protein [Nocardioides lianchengensis]NYG09293.1 hypothetical protein [Nocardioides lianchengensis]SDE31930.1 hypothetical protein SAMN05421872_11957 [Nocardioides lianchengensis]